MTPTQLKAKVNNLSREKGLDPQLVLRHYMMGKFLEVISESEFRDNFVLKGGFLIGSKYGIENRTTKDLDTTLRNITLTKHTLEDTLGKIISKPLSRQSPPPFERKNKNEVNIVRLFLLTI